MNKTKWWIFFFKPCLMTLGWVFLLPNLLREPGDVEHHVRLNDDSKIEAPNAEDLFRVFGLSIPRKI